MSAISQGLQKEILEWQRREFHPQPTQQQDIDGQFLVLAEEVGEVARCLAKGRQNIRGGTAHWAAEMRKESGDVYIALAALAAFAGFDLVDAVNDRWTTVSQRKFRTEAKDAYPYPRCPDCDEEMAWYDTTYKVGGWCGWISECGYEIVRPDEEGDGWSI